VAIELHLDAGLLNTAEAILNGRGTAWVKSLRDLQWDTRIADARRRLNSGRAHEELHGKGSAYQPNHPFAIYARRKPQATVKRLNRMRMEGVNDKVI